MKPDIQMENGKDNVPRTKIKEQKNVYIHLGTNSRFARQNP